MSVKRKTITLIIIAFGLFFRSVTPHSRTSQTHKVRSYCVSIIIVDTPVDVGEAYILEDVCLW